MQIFNENGTNDASSGIPYFTAPYAALPSHIYSATLTISSHYSISPSPSLTAILVSRFLINLQEANLHSIKVDSDDPAYISSHYHNSLPSFVAVAGVNREMHAENIELGNLENREAVEIDHRADNTHREHHLSR